MARQFTPWIVRRAHEAVAKKVEAALEKTVTGGAESVYIPPMIYQDASEHRHLMIETGPIIRRLGGESAGKLNYWRKAKE